MRTSIKIGVSFAMSSAIITILGLMVGLNAGTHSKLVVVSGILMIAIADAMADALGIHISEESEKRHSEKQVWEATFATLFSKFLVSATFLLPVVLFELSDAIIMGMIWGAVLLSFVSFRIAKSRHVNPVGPILEHLVIAFVVVVLSYFVGNWVAMVFG
jgi:VIT1/CCC1 family predicted Fe2+/Mn2+ transporter